MFPYTMSTMQNIIFIVQQNVLVQFEFVITENINGTETLTIAFHPALKWRLLSMHSGTCVKKPPKGPKNCGQLWYLNTDELQ